MVRVASTAKRDPARARQTVDGGDLPWLTAAKGTPRARGNPRPHARVLLPLQLYCEVSVVGPGFARAEPDLVAADAPDAGMRALREAATRVTRAPARATAMVLRAPLVARGTA
jgi:hypothetical protein